jgi:alpha-tubulin suppressor-like RCC1 family protein
MATSLFLSRAVLFLASLSFSAAAAATFPLATPARATTFPLARSTNAGFIAAWGDNAAGQLAADGLGGFVAIAGGVFHSVALNADGTVRAWGRTNEGQLAFPPGLTNVVAISAGFYHTLALTSDGSVVAWGGNTQGQTNVPPDLTNVVAIATRNYHNLALKADGTVVGWGANAIGQTSIPPDLTNVVAIAAGGAHSLALKGDGSVVAWGLDAQGQSTVPPGLTDVVAISAGNNHSLALKNDGSTVGWGSLLGGDVTNAVAISSGGAHNIAAKADGSVQSWGANTYGQTNVPAGLKGVTSVAAGWFFSMALNTEDGLDIVQRPTLPLKRPTRVGKILAWGDNKTGLASVPPYANAAVAVAGSGEVLNYDGTVTIWGSQNPMTIPGMTNIARIAGRVALTEDGTVVTVPQDQPVPGLTNIVAISSSGSHHLALRSNGTVFAFGENQAGRTNVPAGISNAVAVAAWDRDSFALLSDGTIVEWGEGPFLQPMKGFVDINSGIALRRDNVAIWMQSGGLEPGPHRPIVTNVLALASNAAITPDLRVIGLDGQLVPTVFATNSFAFSIGPLALTPREFNPAPNRPGAFPLTARTARGSLAVVGDATGVPIGLPKIVAVATGNNHLLTLSADGVVKGWGDDSQGQATVPPGLTNVVAIAAGSSNSIALRSNGSVIAWGANGAGQSSPPSALAHVVAVAAGGNHALALQSDGTVVEWGEAPAAMPPTLTNIVAIATSGAHAAALTAEGNVLAWGDNSYGQTNVPTELSEVAAIACGARHTIALRRNGTVAVWGDNSSGQLAAPAGLGGIIGVSAGESHSSAIRYDGSLVEWGATNSTSQQRGVLAVAAGNGRTALVKREGLIPIPSRQTTFPLEAPSRRGSIAAWGHAGNRENEAPAGLQDVVQVEAGLNHTVALRENGAAVSWGSNQFGQTNTPALTNAVAISGGYFTSLALKSDGSVTGWGVDYYGSSKMPTPTNPPVFVAVSGGNQHTLGLLPDGRVFGWGQSTYGEAPHGNYGRQQPFSNFSNGVGISAGSFASSVLVADSSIIGWGLNESDYTATPSEMAGMVAVSLGYRHTLALREDGTVHAWGRNSEGQCNVPPGLSNVVGIAAGTYHSVAVKRDGTVVQWGGASNGQVPVPTGVGAVIAVTAGTPHTVALISSEVPRAATASAEVLNGFLTAVNLVNGGSGYTQPPLVIIQGSGQGAEVTAQISNGVVTGFTILSAGEGYTTAPAVSITPPPDESNLQVTTAPNNEAVILSADVAPFSTYQIETSQDLVTWMPYGDPFTAESRTEAEQFPITDDTRFFRLVKIVE